MISEMSSTLRWLRYSATMLQETWKIDPELVPPVRLDEESSSKIQIHDAADIVPCPYEVPWQPVIEHAPFKRLLRRTYRTSHHGNRMQSCGP